MKDNWLQEQAERATRIIESWPQWKRDFVRAYLPNSNVGTNPYSRLPLNHPAMRPRAAAPDLDSSA